MLSILLKYKEKIYSFFVYLIVFLFSMFPYADTDWGWHYKYGEYVLTHGKILMNDIFSWSMPGYAYTPPSWLYDPILYFLTNKIGFVGLSIVSALVCVLTFYILVSLYKLSYWKKAILGFFFILIANIATGAGLRDQVVSLLLFAMEMWILIKCKNNIRLLLLLPLLFLAWVNIHIDFTLGLGIAGLFLGSYVLINFIETRKFPTRNVSVYAITLISSFIVTFINPFTYKVYIESFSHLTNPYMQYINEWGSIFNNFPDVFHYICIGYFLVLLICIGYSITRKKYSYIPYLLFIVLLAWPAFKIGRLIPIFCVVTLPLLAETLEGIKLNLTKLKITDYVTILAIIVCLEYNLYNLFYKEFNLYHYTEDDYCLNLPDCSPKILRYILDHPPGGRGLNDYSLGGYLIGKGFPEKIFIDGRMDAWKTRDYQPFGDFENFMLFNHYDIFTKYNFDWALIPGSSDLAHQLISTKNLGNWKLELQDGTLDYFIHIR